MPITLHGTNTPLVIGTKMVAAIKGFWERKRVLQLLAFEKTGDIVALNEPGRATTINIIF